MTPDHPVLIVEDSPAQGRIIEKLLQSLGRQTYLCGSARDLGRPELSSLSPDAVFLDLYLGDANGADLVPKLRRRWPQAVIVVMTADSRDEFSALSRARARGADFVLRKPFSAADAQDALAEADALRASGRRRTHVLIVDDSAVVCRTLSRFLDTTRYRVFATQDPKEILQRLNFDHVDVVLTDMVMPDMSGRQIIDLVRGVWPDVSVVAMSGDAAILAQAMDGSVAACLKKPFAANELQAAIETAVAARPLPAAQVEADAEADAGDDFVLDA